MLAFLFALLGLGASGASSSRSATAPSAIDPITEPVADPDPVDDPVVTPPMTEDPMPMPMPDDGTGHDDDTPHDHDTGSGTDHDTTDDTGAGHAGHSDGTDDGSTADTDEVPHTGHGLDTDAGTADGPHTGHDTGTGSDTGSDSDHDTGGGHAGHDGGTDIDTTDHDTGGHAGHGDGSTDTALPTTPEEIDAFVDAVRSATEMHVHDASDTRTDEHMKVMELVDPAEATHIAIGNGSWFDASNWHNGEIPGEGAKVVIPQGVTLQYDAVSADSLFTVRVDGQLDFATDTDSSMLVDTLIVAPGGTLTAGTADNPVDADVNVEIVIAGNGAIDTDWDPGLFSRGVISHGKVEIYGEAKDSHEKVTEDPMAGDTSVTFGDLPEGWQVGDTIVVAGTNYDGYEYQLDTKERDYQGTEDEVRVISEIDGNTVHFEDPLEFDHDSPRADLHTSVANYSRNVTVRSENGEDSEIFERGHVMLMHSDDVDVRYAAFEQLGRTDKSEDLHGTGEAQESTIDFDTNVAGRYSLHLHRTGVDDLDNPAILEGNAVFGSPGWGYVHHDSNAILENNASFDTFGAGFVAETGNETGAWNDNIAINAQGVDWDLAKNANNVSEFDIGKSGDGFWFTGRLVESSDNIAASVNHGFIYFHRGPRGEDGRLPFDSELFEFSESLSFDDAAQVNDTPILVANGNEAFASRVGLHVVKENPIQGHDIHSVIDGFTAWSVIEGADIEYTSHYILNDFDLIAKEGTVLGTTTTGISYGNNTFDVILNNSSIEGFRVGIDLNKTYSQNMGEGLSPDHEFVVINTTVDATQTDFRNLDPDLDTILDGPVTPIDAPFVTLDGPLAYTPDNGNTVSITGTKTDSLGTGGFPRGADNYNLDQKDVIRLLEENGYYTTEDGTNYMVINLYFSDGLTGDIYSQSELVEIDSSYPLGNQYHQWADAKDNGEITLSELQAMVDTGSTLLRATDDFQQFTLASYDARAVMEDPDSIPHDHALMQDAPMEAKQDPNMASNAEVMEEPSKIQLIDVMEDSKTFHLTVMEDPIAHMHDDTAKVVEPESMEPAKESTLIDVMEESKVIAITIMEAPKDTPQVEVMEEVQPAIEDPAQQILDVLAAGQGAYAEVIEVDPEEDITDGLQATG